MLPMLRALFKPGGWAHGAGSVALLANANEFFGLSSAECTGPRGLCTPTALEIAAFLCVVAPNMNQGVWRGHFRVYPPVSAPWPARVPPPIPPANLWEKFTLGGSVNVGVFYIQVRGFLLLLLACPL